MKKLIAIFLCLFIFTGCSKKSTEPISSVNDVKDKNIAVIVGTVGATYAEKNCPDAKLFYFNSLSDSIMALKSGEVDTVFHDLHTLNIASTTDNTLAVLPEKLIDTNFSIAVKKGNTNLLDEINTFVADILSDGTYEDIKQRWHIDNDYTLPKITSSGEKGTIKLGVACNTGLPISGVVNNEIVGSAIETGYRFAATYGYTLEVVDMDFSSLIPALNSGKIDFAINDIVVTEERAKQVDFSTPYDSGIISAMVLTERVK